MSGGAAYADDDRAPWYAVTASMTIATLLALAVPVAALIAAIELSFCDDGRWICAHQDLAMYALWALVIADAVVWPVVGTIAVIRRTSGWLFVWPCVHGTILATIWMIGG